MKKQAVVAVIAGVYCAMLVAPPPGQCQTYHYQSGGSRVVRQSQTGLYYSDPSYIGPGTLSQTAQGKQIGGGQANPGLPKVPWGANISTPGDNMYSPAPVKNKGAAGVPTSKWGANVGQAGDNMRSDLDPSYTQSIHQSKYVLYKIEKPKQPKGGYLYKPGSTNSYGGTSTYGGGGSASSRAERY